MRACYHGRCMLNSSARRYAVTREVIRAMPHAVAGHAKRAAPRNHAPCSPCLPSWLSWCVTRYEEEGNRKRRQEFATSTLLRAAAQVALLSEVRRWQAAGGGRAVFLRLFTPRAAPRAGAAVRHGAMPSAVNSCCQIVAPRYVGKAGDICNIAKYAP